MEKILSITAQKPHSTGSGTYLTEVVEALGRMEYEQAVIAGIYPSDEVLFSDNVKFYPVYFEEDFPIYGMSDVMPYPSS
ncbi:MAG: glycosyl transferase family 1, partial [Clostridiales bacterium]|nr:glycosyl transferase family 1 [Clostridiales bacterium]